MALTHARAGADETLVVQDGEAALPAGALAVPFVEQARPRATPDLGREGSGQLRRNAHLLFPEPGDLGSPRAPP